MSHRLQVLIPPELDTQLAHAAQRSRLSKGAWVRRALQKAVDRSAYSTPGDPVECLASLDAPTTDIDRMLTEIESGRT